MRIVTFGAANSLDNFIAREDGAVDWLLWTKEVAEITKEYWQTIDTVVMGRKTFEVATQNGAGAYPGVRNFVLSRKLKKRFDGFEVVSDDAADFLRRLKNTSGKGICVMGGGLLARSLLEADLIDEIGLNLHPVVLGKGVPLFHDMKSQIDLKLINCTQLSNGCVVLRYRVKHKGSR
jgi:dihydrofolate reductase